jgi:surface antigen
MTQVGIAHMSQFWSSPSSRQAGNLTAELTLLSLPQESTMNKNPTLLTVATLALSGALFLFPAAASAEDCGVLSPTTGNLIGSAVGGAAGGLIGNQFGKGGGKGVMTGVGVVGGALAGGYVGRSVEGCGRAAPPAAASAPATSRPAVASSGSGRSCRFVLTQAVIDGREQQINGVACLEPDGTWKTASGAAAERAAETDLILRAQQALRDRGFYVQHNIDGRWGPATSTSVRNFQQANGLGPTGRLDPATQEALAIAPAALVARADTPQAGPAQQVSAPAAGNAPRR